MAKSGVLPKPIKFGKYYLLELVNTGGMAEIYRAKKFGAEGFQKQLAVKRILPKVAEDDSFISMFVDEAKITANLNHPNIAQIEDLGFVENSYCIIMEYISGHDLKAIYRQARKDKKFLSVEQVCYIVARVCEGLGYAHQKTDNSGKPLGIVHRDISPQNILVSYEGEVKVIDFGIAKAANRETKTQAGVLKGKFSYMSPEQARCQELDQRSDLFSVGIVFYELLTLSRLFRSETDFDTLQKITAGDVPLPSTINQNVPPELDEIVLKALAKDKDERYRTTFEFAEAIERFLREKSLYYSQQNLSAYMKKTFHEALVKESEKQEVFNSWDLAADAQVVQAGQDDFLADYYGHMGLSEHSSSSEYSAVPPGANPFRNSHSNITQNFGPLGPGAFRGSGTQNSMVMPGMYGEHTFTSYAAAPQRSKLFTVLMSVLILVVLGVSGTSLYFMVNNSQSSAAATYALTINTMPNSAMISIPGQVTTYMSPATLNLKQKNVEILIHKRGYEPIQETIVMPQKVHSISRVLKPVLLELSVESSDPEVSFSLLDEVNNTIATKSGSPSIFKNIKAVNIHKIRLSKGGYSVVHDFNWNQEKNQKLFLNFTSPQQEGSSSDQEDDTDKEVTRKRSPSPSRRVVRRPTPRVKAKPQDAPPKETSPKEKPEVKVTGKLSVKLQDGLTGTIYIDGKKSNSFPVYKVSVTAGSHSVRVVNPLIKYDQTKSVTVEEDKHQIVSFAP